MKLRHLALLLLLHCIVPVARAAQESRPLLHRYTTTERSYVVNAFWLESTTGIVLIDTLMLKSDASALAAAIRSSGKPLTAVLLTHPHGDHFGGMATLRKAFPKAEYVATRATADAVKPNYERIMRQPWIRAYGDDFERELVIPERIVKDGETIALAGMHFTFHDLGAMEADNNTLIENRETGAIFSGDATVANALFYVGEGHSRHALTQLQALKARFPADAMVYSGHYESMRLGPVVDDNIAQVTYLRAAMRGALSTPAKVTAAGELTEAARAHLVREVAAHLSDHADYGIGPVDAANSVNLPGLEVEIRREIAADHATKPTAETP